VQGDWEEEQEKLEAEGYSILTRTVPANEDNEYRVQVVKPNNEAVSPADFHAGIGINKVTASQEDREKPFQLPDYTRQLLVKEWRDKVSSTTQVKEMIYTT